MLNPIDHQKIIDDYQKAKHIEIAIAFILGITIFILLGWGIYDAFNGYAGWGG